MKIYILLGYKGLLTGFENNNRLFKETQIFNAFQKCILSSIKNRLERLDIILIQKKTSI